MNSLLLCLCVLSGGPAYEKVEVDTVTRSDVIIRLPDGKFIWLKREEANLLSQQLSSAAGGPVHHLLSEAVRMDGSFKGEKYGRVGGCGEKSPAAYFKSFKGTSAIVEPLSLDTFGKAIREAARKHLTEIECFRYGWPIHHSCEYIIVGRDVYGEVHVIRYYVNEGIK